MYHVVAWTESIATGALNDLQPVVDNIIVIQNNHFLPQKDFGLAFIAVMATDIQRARLISPTFRQFTTPHVRGLIFGLAGMHQPPIADYAAQPLRIRALEEFAIEAEHDAGVAQRVTAVAGWYVGSPTPMPAGDMFTMRGTSTTAATANVWSTLAMTWDDILPNGTYAAVGMHHFSANGQAARMVFEDQVYRPGGVSITDRSQECHYMFRSGYLGEYGRFDSNRMPTIEVLCNGADAAHDVYIDFVRVR